MFVLFLSHSEASRGGRLLSSLPKTTWGMHKLYQMNSAVMILIINKYKSRFQKMFQNVKQWKRKSVQTTYKVPALLLQDR